MTEYGRINIKYDFPASQETPKPEKPKNRMSRRTIIEFFAVTTILGAAVFGFDRCMRLYAWLIKKTTLFDYYRTSETAFNIIQSFYSLFAILLPFGIALLLLKILLRKDLKPLPFEAPHDRKFFIAGLCIAFLTLVVANFAVGLVGMGLEAIGFEIEGSEVDAPKSVAGFFWQILSVCIVPAVCEEFAIRGVMLQSLRRYGDTFAIVVSSVFFGLMHGHILQAPFAFILSAVIALLVISTGSLWTGIAIHFMNNFYAVIITTLYTYLSTGAYIAIVVPLNIGGCILGILGIVWVVDKKGRSIIPHDLYAWQPYVFSVISPALLGSFLFFVHECASTIHYAGGA